MTDSVQKPADPLQIKNDIVLLVDLVTEHSRAVQLVDYESLKNEFIEKAALTAPVAPEQVKAAIESVPTTLADEKFKDAADDSPCGKEKRRLLSRRAMLTSLFRDELADEAKAATPKVEAVTAKREITPEYFDVILAQAMEGNFGLNELTSWDGIRYFNFSPLLSSSYARLLASKNNPYELLIDTVRENSRIYPRPIGLYCFEFPPFNLKPEVIQEIVDRLGQDENAKDIRVTVTSLDSVYLYSSKYLDDNYADFLAEQMDDETAQML